jgi:hypothetical protein
MSKLYKAIVLTQNEYDYIQVRYCNDLKSRIYRLSSDVQKSAIESAILKLAKLEKSNTQELLAVNM